MALLQVAMRWQARGVTDFPGYDGRSATADDARWLLPLYEASDLSATGTVDFTEADIDGLLRDPRSRLERSLLLSRAGTPVAVMVPSVRTPDADGAVPFDLEVVVHPDHPGVHEGLVRAGLAAAREHAAEVDHEVRVDVWTLEPSLQETLAGLGFARSARHVRLHRDLAGDEQEPAPREDVRVRLVDGEDDRRTFHATLVSVFSDSGNTTVDPYDLWSARMASSDVNDPAQWWLLERRTAGEWLAVGLVQGNRKADEDGHAWIRNYGLTPGARGVGLGGYLLRWAIARFAAFGHRGVGLGADLDNTTAALDVYARAGFRQLYSAERFSLLT